MIIVVDISPLSSILFQHISPLFTFSINAHRYFYSSVEYIFNIFSIRWWERVEEKIEEIYMWEKVYRPWLTLLKYFSGKKKIITLSKSLKEGSDITTTMVIFISLPNFMSLIVLYPNLKTLACGKKELLVVRVYPHEPKDSLP